MSEKTWKTAITTHKDGTPVVRGYKLTDLLKKVNFTQTIFLVLKGELPTEIEEKMLSTILVASIDHGVEAPSTTVARITASAGVPLSTAVANGVATIGTHHGGAIEQAAKLFQEAVKGKEPASSIVRKAKEEGKRLPGFGHKIYNVDPRTQAVLEVAKDNNFTGPHIELSVQIESELTKAYAAVDKKIPLNIDGITAAIISDLGFDASLGNGFFIISRIVGLVAHVHEEQTREKPVAHRLSEEDVEYDGTPPRELP